MLPHCTGCSELQHAYNYGVGGVMQRKPVLFNYYYLIGKMIYAKGKSYLINA
jgi:hypothetical protein